VAGRRHRNGPGRGASAAIIDAHVHVCVLDPLRYPWQPLLGYIPRAAAPVEALLGAMAVSDVGAAVLVQPSYYGYGHGYLQEALARHPGILAGVGLADPEAPVFADGCRGVRLNAVGHPGRGWLAATEAAGFWDAAERAGLVLTAQCGPEQVAEFAALAARHPLLPCVIDHLGRGAFDDLVAAAGVSNLHVKVSGLSALSGEPAPHRGLWPAVSRVIAAFGPGRCLFGTDASPADPAAYRAQVTLWAELFPLHPAERAEILGGTAHRLFFAPREVRAWR